MLEDILVKPTMSANKMDTFSMAFMLKGLNGMQSPWKMEKLTTNQQQIIVFIGDIILYIPDWRI